MIIYEQFFLIFLQTLLLFKKAIKKQFLKFFLLSFFFVSHIRIEIIQEQENIYGYIFYIIIYVVI